MARALLISTYDLGHQPFGLASPAAWLKDAGLEVECADLSRQRLDDAAVQRADLVAFHLPMHTATRMAGPVIRRVHAARPGLRICAYGLYAPLNADWLKELGVSDVLGGEFEAALSAIGREVAGHGADREPSGDGLAAASPVPGPSMPRLRFLVPDRSGLPPVQRYGALRLADGTTVVAGYTEASRGCRHLCRHCPIVPVYEGQFRVVQRDVVMADIDAQVSAGARHITFGDPDFFNGPTHASRLVEELHHRHPGLTYDVTIKVEHLLTQQARLPQLRDTGCLFVTSAVESLDDRMLARLEKGHTRADFERALQLCRDAGLTLSPTFVPFHPWMSLGDYCDLLLAIDRLGLVGQVAPIQLAIRLLLPSGSRLLELPDVRERAGRFDAATLTHRWEHDDPRVDALQADVASLVGRKGLAPRGELFASIVRLAFDRAGKSLPDLSGDTGVEPVPQFDEPWYCCAEPAPEQLTLV